MPQESSPLPSSSGRERHAVGIAPGQLAAERGCGLQQHLARIEISMSLSGRSRPAALSPSLKWTPSMAESTRTTISKASRMRSGRGLT